MAAVAAPSSRSPVEVGGGDFARAVPHCIAHAPHAPTVAFACITAMSSRCRWSRAAASQPRAATRRPQERARNSSRAVTPRRGRLGSRPPRESASAAAPRHQLPHAEGGRRTKCVRCGKEGELGCAKQGGGEGSAWLLRTRRADPIPRASHAQLSTMDPGNRPRTAGRRSRCCGWRLRGRARQIRRPMRGACAPDPLMTRRRRPPATSGTWP